MSVVSNDRKRLEREIAVMKKTAVELRRNGGEPSDNFKRRLCIKAARLKEVNKREVQRNAE